MTTTHDPFSPSEEVDVIYTGADVITAALARKAANDREVEQATAEADDNAARARAAEAVTIHNMTVDVLARRLRITDPANDPTVAIYTAFDLIENGLRPEIVDLYGRLPETWEDITRAQAETAWVVLNDGYGIRVPLVVQPTELTEQTQIGLWRKDLPGPWQTLAPLNIADAIVRPPSKAPGAGLPATASADYGTGRTYPYGTPIDPADAPLPANLVDPSRQDETQ